MPVKQCEMLNPNPLDSPASHSRHVFSWLIVLPVDVRVIEKLFVSM